MSDSPRQYNRRPRLTLQFEFSGGTIFTRAPMHRSAPQLMLIVLLLGLVLMRESHDPPLANLEANFVNWLASNTTRQNTMAPLALVEINDASLETQHYWPWLPLDYALFFENVLRFKPTVVGVEPILTWNEKELPPDDQMKFPQFENILLQRMRRAPKVLVAAQLGFPEDFDLTPPLQPLPLLRRITGSVRDIPSFTIVEKQPKEEMRLSARLGFVNLPVSTDPYRKAPLLFSYQGQIVPSFVLQALMMWFSLSPEDIRADIGSQIMLGDRFAVPIDETGSMVIDFKTPFTRVGFDDLLLATTQMDANSQPIVARSAIDGKFALLARVDAAARTLRFSNGQTGAPGELFAAAIATVQSQSFFREIGAWFDGLVIAVMMFFGWFVYRRPRGYAPWMALVLLTAYLMVALLVFSLHRLALPLVLPVGLAAFIALFRLFAPRDGIMARGAPTSAGPDKPAI